jgi:hypothetical protein
MTSQYRGFDRDSHIDPGVKDKFAGFQSISPQQVLYNYRAKYSKIHNMLIFKRHIVKFCR